MRRVRRDRFGDERRLGPRLLRWLLLAVAVVMLAAGAVVMVAQYRWRAATDVVRAQLQGDARPRPAARYVETELANLPIPVSRFFRAVLTDGQRIVSQARVTWAGEFNMGAPGADRWVPFTADQDFWPGAPGMVWDARMAMYPGVAVWVRDGVVRGRGSMRAAAMGLVTVAQAAGTAGLDTAALQRYLAEAIWLPTALLPSQGVSWTAIDARQARASLTAGATTVSVDFRFGEDGRVVSAFVPDRTYDDGRTPPAPHPWQARILAYGEHDGMAVPTDAVVEWLMPAGTFAYWRARPAAIAYEYR
jgi:hypothetical protein